MKRVIFILPILMFVCILTTSAQYKFKESDKVLRVEMEAVPPIEKWIEKETAFPASGSYYVWLGDQYFDKTGVGLLEYTLLISTPGTYRFKWHRKIGKGESTTDHNDTWLRFPDASDYYGKRWHDGHIARPHGICTSDCPVGAGSNGWFKVYSSGSTDWTWTTYTSDSDAHNLFVKFDTAGEYKMQVSARSSYQYLDRFVLFMPDFVSDSIAQSLNFKKSDLYPFSKVEDITLINDAVYSFELENIDTSVTISKVISSDKLKATVSISPILNESATVKIVPNANQTGIVTGTIKYQNGKGSKGEVNFKIQLKDGSI